MKRFINILFWAFALHLIFSLTFIFFPSLLAETKISKIYKTYLLPGPFFTADRIENSYLLTLSWKVNGEWSPPINTAKNNFDKYQHTHNLLWLYRSRLERSLYQKISLDKLLVYQIMQRKEFVQLKNYLEKNRPPDATEVRMVILQKESKNFYVHSDTLHVFSWD